MEQLASLLCWKALYLFMVVLATLPHRSMQGPYEKKLLHHLLDKYNVLERPVSNESDPIQISFGITLMQIIDVDEKNQLLITNMWLKMDWNDYNLRWNSSEFGGVKDLRIPPTRIWKPDVLMYNSADEEFDSTYQTNVVVRNNGSCSYLPPGIFKSTCKIDITWFPFDDQKCELKFGSWTYDGFQLDLTLQSEEGGDISNFNTNGEWDLLGVPGKRTWQYYPCCPEPYVDITFSIEIRRRTLYYFFNLIVPCVLIASMAVLGFTLPPESGEKLSLGVTVLLSLTFLLNSVTSSMPPASAQPLIGTYFNCIMFMVASSVVSTVLILNYHHRNADTHEMASWVRTLFLHWLPWVLRMSRPTDKDDQKPAAGPAANSKQMKDIEMKERSSRSLLANVLDIDDDFRQHSCTLSSVGSGMALSMGVPTGFPRVVSTPSGGLGNNQGQDETISLHNCFGSHRELSGILKELRVITEKIRTDEEDSRVCNDWKFAAMVVDRICLILFTLFTIIATIAVLFSAPHIIVP
ncbi:neuronal acetylcholine receptor subunit alpha-7-like isoform X2 [Daphnia pulex]|uniref:neuronal acetylcholine receptor subunit alpha-7-like isoform X2 n=1 Tax=Daphnia pulex TaxID=6669 RepID=UPI001EDDDF94|nr:neuronal acetylcholine receptor subunit alpha-7-like isoform X2 [Daphnia pulex]